MVQYPRRKQSCRGRAQGRDEGHCKQRKSCCKTAARSRRCDGNSRVPEPNGAEEREQQPRIEIPLRPQLRRTRRRPADADMAIGIEVCAGSTGNQEQHAFPLEASLTALRSFQWRLEPGSAPQRFFTAQLPQATPIIWSSLRTGTGAAAAMIASDGTGAAFASSSSLAPVIRRARGRTSAHTRPMTCSSWDCTCSRRWAVAS